MSNKNPTISIIIPVLNEEHYLGKLLIHISDTDNLSYIKEIIIVDGGSTDATIATAKQFDVTVIPSKKGRAKQMNLGAEHAHGDILYFLHADTLPPKKFHQFIRKAVNSGYGAGCFRLKFDTKNLFLRFFAWFSRINTLLCRGGDQTLFIEKELYEKIGGFNENYQIYEDTEFIGRIYKNAKFKVIPNYVTTSARKYREFGPLKLQYHFAMIHFKNMLGADANDLYRYYQKHISS